MKKLVRIGTRGSPLALWQADHITRLLREAFDGLVVEREIIRTEGDRIQDRPLLEVGGKGLFVKEIEQALLDGRVDLAVHSLKDVPAEQPPGLVLAAFPPRASACDVVVFGRPGLRLDTLPTGARVGTGSLRRATQLRHLRADLEVVPIRGNVDTRLRRLSGEAPLDAVVLAEAGLARLDLLSHHPHERLAPDRFVPAPCQGILGIEIRADDDATRALLAALHHADTALVALAERACLRAIGGDCHTPFGAHAVRDGDALRLHARLLDEQGRVTDLERRVVLGADTAAAADGLGDSLGRDLLERHCGDASAGSLPTPG
jgi:hydroxymethylbilane synthase